MVDTCLFLIIMARLQKGQCMKPTLLAIKLVLGYHFRQLASKDCYTGKQNKTKNSQNNILYSHESWASTNSLNKCLIITPKGRMCVSLHIAKNPKGGWAGSILYVLWCGHMAVQGSCTFPARTAKIYLLKMEGFTAKHLLLQHIKKLLNWDKDYYRTSSMGKELTEWKREID